jgi:cardiolipin synthase
MEAGVKVYRYKPGFIHSKMIIADNQKALIGTANLDFRSLYLHFENMVYLDGGSVIPKLTQFFNDTIEQSEYIEIMQKRNVFYRLLRTFLKSFSTLL